jgi:hypothetical protein
MSLVVSVRGWHFFDANEQSNKWRLDTEFQQESLPVTPSKIGVYNQWEHAAC